VLYVVAKWPGVERASGVVSASIVGDRRGEREYTSGHQKAVGKQTMEDSDEGVFSDMTRRVGVDIWGVRDKEPRVGSRGSYLFRLAARKIPSGQRATSALEKLGLVQDENPIQFASIHPDRSK
jgi:hypothetical protein